MLLPKHVNADDTTNEPVPTKICMYVCMCVSMQMAPRMKQYLKTCMHACMYACMYGQSTHIHTYTHTHIHTTNRWFDVNQQTGRYLKTCINVCMHVHFKEDEKFLQQVLMTRLTATWVWHGDGDEVVGQAKQGERRISVWFASKCFFVSLQCAWRHCTSRRR